MKKKTLEQELKEHRERIIEEREDWKYINEHGCNDPSWSAVVCVGGNMKQKILDFIISYIQIHGYPPTVREIGEGVGLNSTSSVQEHLVCMREIGMIETDAESGKSRAIRVPGYKFVKEKQDEQ
ncbi:hypothetical protein ACTM9K_03785 [Bariatricus sp. HCP3S3_E12]|uniref:LexA family protein n=1 Tax=Bariatricus sp. HCP3S3_E12 TaxID=3438906 RepID=UPI003F8A2144